MLTRALQIGLEQSPLVDVIGEREKFATLKMMGKSTGTAFGRSRLEDGLFRSNFERARPGIVQPLPPASCRIYSPSGRRTRLDPVKGLAGPKLRTLRERPADSLLLTRSNGFRIW
jgi:hypothetical protein